MKNFIQPLESLVNELSKLGGVGKKTAERYAYNIINGDDDWVARLADSIITAKRDVKMCTNCGMLTDKELCDYCANDHKEPIVCVVKEPKDVFALEKVGDFAGSYHVLHGVISPLDGKGPDDINLKSLITRIAKENIKEVIMSTNPDVEGEATALYVANLLRPLGVKVSRIAQGISLGSELEYADEYTLKKALENRTEI